MIIWIRTSCPLPPTIGKSIGTLTVRSHRSHSILHLTPGFCFFAKMMKRSRKSMIFIKQTKLACFSSALSFDPPETTLHWALTYTRNESLGCYVVSGDVLGIVKRHGCKKNPQNVKPLPVSVKCDFFFTCV